MPTYRTSEDAVRSVIETDPDVSLTPFIETANLLVTEKCLPAGYSDARLEMIERWLAAHFYRVDKDQNLAERQTGSGRFRVDPFKFGEGLKMTRPGQQVLMLDDQKTLTHAVPTAVNWLGTTRP